MTFVGFLGLATPSFLLALVLLYLANVYFGISIGGLMDPVYVDKPWSWGKALSVAAHLWIPVIVIGTAGTAAMIRRLRANLLDELQKQYVVTARAKGLHPLKVLFKYPLRMALNPFISDIGSLLPHVISGAAVVSIVMSLPTTGPMLLEALRSQDMFLAGSFLMFMAFSDRDRRVPVRSRAGGARPAHPPADRTIGMTGDRNERDRSHRRRGAARASGGRGCARRRTDAALRLAGAVRPVRGRAR